MFLSKFLMNPMRILLNWNKCTEVLNNLLITFKCINTHALVPCTSAGDAPPPDIGALFDF